MARGFVTGTGVKVETPPVAAMERRLADADQPGQHLWLFTIGYLCTDPERPTAHLDAENVIIVAGPGCLKCEREYSRKLAKMPCRGSVDQLQPLR
jgi:hypothetical protein